MYPPDKYEELVQKILRLHRKHLNKVKELTVKELSTRYDHVMDDLHILVEELTRECSHY